MEKSVAVVAIIISDVSAVERVNSLLSAFREDIIGRMGLPHRHGLNIISICLESTKEKINSLSGKLGMIDGVSSRVLIAK